jgi:hypothetical protein
LSHERVAAALGVTVSSARSLVTRARQRLAPLLEEHVPDVKERMASDDMFAEQSTLRWLHVTNGDSAAGTLRRSGLPGDVTVWADALHDGPVRPDSGTEAWRRARARFVEQAGWLTEEEAMRMTTAWDAALDAFRNYDEVVLWFEHDLFDQLLLVRHLEWFGRQTPPPVRLSLICIGAYPGIEPFHGLGQLSPDQFASLIDTRQRVTARQLELGRSTWLAFTAAEPTALERILAADTSSLPFLAGALQRLIEEYPSAGNGLSRSERQIVEALADGPRTLDAVFVACARMEERVFMGDTAFLTRLEQLATVPHPLLHIERRPAAQPFPDGTATLTATGQRVRAGEDDMIRLNGIDRWVGGVHLHQGEGGVLWRRDDDSGRLVRASPGRSVS